MTELPHDAETILMTGMFDMHNFGDLLFPLVAQNRLAPHGFAIQPVSATGQRPDLKDAVPSLALPDVLANPPDAKGVLIGGGYIIHTHRLDLLREYRDGDTGAWVGASTWLGAEFTGALLDVPIAWNAPGVPHPLSGTAKLIAAETFAASSYFSVRDEGSKKLLGPSAENALVVPDTIIDLPKLWSSTALSADYRALLERLGLDPNAKILAVHTRGRSLAGEPLTAFAARLQVVCERLGLTPVFIGLGSAHNDNVIANTLNEAFSIPSAALSAPQSLREIAALLAHASAYVGSSLHGYVAAYAYGRPAILVGRPAYQKFRGFVEHVKRPMDLAKSWDEALVKLADATPPGPRPTEVDDALDQHWGSIACAFRDGPEKERAARMQFLRRCIACGIEKGGAGWSFLPFTTQASLDAARSGDDFRNREPM